MRLTELKFSFSFKELCDLYGKKYDSKQEEQYWKILNNLEWEEEKFMWVIATIKEKENTFPSLARLVMTGRDFADPGKMITKEEAEALWDSIPECENCCEGIVYLIPKFKGEKLMGACSVCEKGKMRLKANKQFVAIHPLSLRTPGGKNFQYSHKLDPVSHAKWGDLTTKECKSMLGMLPKGGELQKEYIRCIKTYRHDIFEELLREER